MCTIILQFGVRADHPLVIAANRDELYARAASPAGVYNEQHPRVIAGRDLQRGGTWMGATEHGFFVGITNQRTWHPADRARASRGHIVRDALLRDSTDGVVDLLRSIDPARYNPFNLMFGDAERMVVAYVRDEPTGVEMVELPHGVHVLTNDRMGSPDFPKADRAKAAAEKLVGVPFDAWVPEIRKVLADHTQTPIAEVTPPPPTSPLTVEFVARLSAVCVHTDVYGTRSSTIVAADRGRLARYLFAQGTPCVTDFQSVV